MPDLWAGRLRGDMFQERIKVRELAQEAGLSYTYVIDILAGRRIVPDARERLEAAYHRIAERRKQEKNMKRVHLEHERASSEQSAVGKPNNSVYEEYNTP